MKITHGEILRLRIPLSKPFVTSFGSMRERDIVLVKFKEGKNFGTGEAPVLSLPIYNPETPESVVAVLQRVIFPMLRKSVFGHPSTVAATLEFIRGNHFAKSAAEMACWDLYGKNKGKRLVDLLGGTKKKLTISQTLSIHPTITDVLDEAQRYVAQGQMCLKLKIKPGYDLTYARALRKKFPQTKLMLDANASYILNRAAEHTFAKCHALKIFCIEQPLQPYDIIDHAKLQKKIKTPIALDESIESFYDAKKALELGGCRLVNIKIARVGGITNALAINNLCRKSKIPTWVGGMLESPIGFYANLALATVRNFDYPVDFLGGLSYIKDYERLFERKPFSIQGNYLTPSLNLPGLGLELNRQLFDRYTVERIRLH